MKKEKSKVIFGILTVLVTVFLILNILFQNFFSNCEKEVNVIQENITESWFRVAIQQSHALSFFELQILNPQNTSQIKETNPKVKSWWEMFGLMTNGSKATLSNIEIMKNQSQIEIEKCKKIDVWVDIWLYLALVFSLVTIGYGALIYKLYHT